MTRAPYVQLSTLSDGTRFKTESGRAGTLLGLSVGSARVRWEPRERSDGATDASEENVALSTEVYER